MRGFFFPLLILYPEGGRQVHGVVGRTRFLPFRGSEAETGRVDPLQDEVPEVGRHLLPAGATVVEVEDHDRDYDRNGRNGHHHRQVDACREKAGKISAHL